MCRRSRNRVGRVLTTLLVLAVVVAFGGMARAEFPLKEGDVWVMAGDSITAQHLHSNYFEAFCFARYPQLKFAFRNSGVGGHTIPTTLARFDYDIAAWKPTVVSVELGMNDSGGTSRDKFIANMLTMVARIRGVQARPVILSASPVNDGTLLENVGGRNLRLHEYAVDLKKLAAEQGVPYADQFHALVDVWGRNKPNESLANLIPQIRMLSQDNKLRGAEHLRAFLAAQAYLDRPLVSMQGDPVHPGPNGQVMMAAALLKELGADGFVSSVTLDATGKVIDSKGAKVDMAAAASGGVSFTRTDERLPFPVPDGTLDALPLYPPVWGLSEYMLAVKGLKPGRYELSIGGVATGTSLFETDWEAGVNVTAMAHKPGANGEANPVLAQSRAILQAVSAKEGIVGQWRGLSREANASGAAANLKQQLADLKKKVEEADQKIRDAAKPQPQKWALTPAK